MTLSDNAGPKIGG